MNNKPKIAFMTTLGVNIGDEFIREGISSFLDEIYEQWDPFYVNKVDLQSLHQPLEDEPCILNDKFRDADIIIQAGAPVYWKLEKSTSYNVEWAEELWRKRIFQLGAEKPILNIAAGACQPYPDFAKTFLNDPACVQFAKSASNSCQWTSARDPLASHILYALEIKHEVLPCTAFHAARRSSFHDSGYSQIIGINLMPLGGHYKLKGDIDEDIWAKTIEVFLLKLRKHHSLLFIAHDTQEKEFMKRYLGPGEVVFYSSKWRDYLPVYSRCTAIVANRVHGAVCAAGFGRPAVILGNDTRLLIADYIGIPSIYITKVNPEEIVSIVETTIAEHKKEKERLLTLREESAARYRKAILENLENFPTSKIQKKQSDCLKNPCLASKKELISVSYRDFMTTMNCFARRWNLRQFTNWSKVWEYPWLWFNGLCRIDWSKTTVLDLGSELSPMPWFLASLGAKVTLLETDANSIHIWEKIKRETGLSVDWKIVDDEQLPFRDESFDVVTSFSVIEHQLDKGKAVNEIARVLKPGGTFALSFDICEPEMGMTFPAWNGKALTTREFEDIIWNHPAFEGKGIPLKWNFEDCREFVNWHLQSAPHHNYTVGAAVLQKIGLGEPKTINVKRIAKPVFLHIPKAAGTTFLQMLINAFGQEHVYWLNHFEYAESFKKLQDIEQTDPERIYVIIGHINYGIHNILSNDYAYFTVLRDPVQRVLSFFDYAYSSTQHPLYETLRKGPIDFSDPKILNNISNLQTRLLCNSTVSDVSILSSVSQEYLKIAKQRLQKCAVVGITEEFDGFVRLVNAKFGWSLSKIQEQNVTPERKHRTRVDQSMTEIIKEHNRLDIELYEYAKELFYKQLQEISR